MQKTAWDLSPPSKNHLSADAAPGRVAALSWGIAGRVLARYGRAVGRDAGYRRRSAPSLWVEGVVRPRTWCAAAVVVVVLTALVHWPVLRFELTGDDYETVGLAHEACLHPAMLFAPLGEWLRPATIWSLAVDRVLWGTDPAGYHATTLAIHLVTVLVLLAAAAVLGLRPGIALAVALLWGCSPFTDENAVWAAIRHENTLLLGWLVAVVAWPGPDRAWTNGRIAAAVGGVLLAALSKETWIATPFILGALELVRTRWRWRPALTVAGATGVFALAYVALRFMAFPGTQGYFEWSPAPLAKLPHLLAAFLGLEELRPVVTTVGWGGAAGSALVAAAAVLAWRWRSRAALVGLALLLPPLGPTLFVPFLPQRYAAIPYSGFLLLAGGLLETGLRRLGPRPGRFAAALAATAAVAVFAVGAVTVRADQEDWRRISDAHGVLLREARLVADELPVGIPVALVRDEHTEPLQEIVDHPAGLEKLQYLRGSAPYGLVDAGPLFDWVRGGPRTIVRDHPDWRTRYAGFRGRILVHRAGGFQWVDGEVPDLAAAASRWVARGLPVRVITVERSVE